MSMPNTSFYFVRPTDSLFVRGNLAFGDSGEHGSGVMPPPPSLFAGAFRSALLGKDAAQMVAFLAHGGRCTNPAMHQCVGTPAEPGRFAINWLSLALDSGGYASGANRMPEAISPLPADLLLLGEQFAPLVPRAIAQDTQSAGDLPLRATLQSAKQEKPAAGAYLRQSGLALHLQGMPTDKSHSVNGKDLYMRDPRLGIGINTDARTAEEGQIYTTEGFAFQAGAGFLVGITGLGDLLPSEGQLRLGGDGRSAHYRRVDFTPPEAGKAVSINKRFRLLLQTPALFSAGWLPDGVTQHDDGSYRLQADGFSARLACAALGRREVVSGWDLYNWMPKPAQAAAPAGSVYWFDEFDGEAGKLAAWVQAGLWPDNPGTMQKTRRAEGYNRALLGAWN